MNIPDEELKPEKTYNDYLTEFLNSLIILKDQSLQNREELYKQLATVEDALETMLNWIKIEKNGIRNFETLLEWTENLVKDDKLDKDEIRYRLRVVMQPQVESFIQNITLGEKSALKILDVVNKNVQDIPEFMRTVQNVNFKLLSIIGYEPESQTSHLDLALLNLYQGRFKDYEKELKLLNNNLKPPKEEKEKNSINPN
ncbi:MAG: hypothetical protein ACFFAU_13890 [Candidatus Hodarchaeota archaeon]